MEEPIVMSILYSTRRGRGERSLRGRGYKGNHSFSSRLPRNASHLRYRSATPGKGNLVYESAADVAL